MDGEIEKKDEIDEKEEITIGVSYLKAEQSVCFIENGIFTVELPVSQHNMLEVKEAKLKEVQNLED